jgi:transposase
MRRPCADREEKRGPTGSTKQEQLDLNGPNQRGLSDDYKGFEVLPRRWVVERTFGWMTRWRRLVRDYEARIDVSQAMILVAMGGNLLRRTTHP